MFGTIRREIHDYFEASLKAIDSSLDELHRAIQNSLMGGDWSAFYLHKLEWQTKNRLWLILGNRFEKEAAHERIMLWRNPPPSRSPSPLAGSEDEDERERSVESGLTGLTSIATFRTLQAPPSSR